MFNSACVERCSNEVNTGFWSTQQFQLIYTGLFEMIVGGLTTCHTQYTWDRSICIFLFNRTTLQGFLTYVIGALYVHPLWFYKHQHENLKCIVYDKVLKSRHSFRITLYIYIFHIWMIDNLNGYQSGNRAISTGCLFLVELRYSLGFDKTV